jgi:hypothetical protein
MNEPVRKPIFKGLGRFSKNTQRMPEASAQKTTCQKRVLFFGHFFEAPPQ